MFDKIGTPTISIIEDDFTTQIREFHPFLVSGLDIILFLSLLFLISDHFSRRKMNERDVKNFQEADT